MIKPKFVCKKCFKLIYQKGLCDDCQERKHNWDYNIIRLLFITFIFSLGVGVGCFQIDPTMLEVILFISAIILITLSVPHNIEY
jgi:phage shock protein PspC (stress-responsive transcriptional regulator)